MGNHAARTAPSTQCWRSDCPDRLSNKLRARSRTNHRFDSCPDAVAFSTYRFSARTRNCCDCHPLSSGNAEFESHRSSEASGIRRCAQSCWRNSPVVDRYRSDSADVLTPVELPDFLHYERPPSRSASRHDA